jgi:hypothetical protein
MNGEVQLIISTGSSVTYTTGAGALGLEGGVSNDSTFPPVLTNDILNAFLAQALYGGNGTINAYDSSDVLLGTYQLDAVRATVGGAEGQFYFPYLGEGSPINPTTAYITFQVNTTQQSYLDLFENESISQNWKFQDLNSFTAQGSFTREFRVPYSATNQLALGALFDVNVDAGSANYFHYKLPAEIRVDTLPIATGYVRVRKIYKQQNRINEVELAFYAETPDLVRNIGEKKLSDLDALSALNETVGYDNVTNASADRIWTILDRGQRWSENGETNTRPLTNASTPVFASDLTPAICWQYLFDNIIKEAGFELVGGTLQSILSQYWMPWCNSQTLITSSSFNTYNFQAYPSTAVGLNNFMTTIPINTEVFDNNSNFDTGTNTYTAPGGGFFTFRVTAEFTNSTANPIDVVVALAVNGVTAFNEVFIGTIDNGSVIDASITVGLETGDTVQLKALQTFAAGTGFVSIISGTATTFSLTSVNLYYGQTITYSLNAPDMKQIDFVTDVIKMHNCAIVADRAVPSKIYIVPQNSYLGSGNVLDWTSKLDISKDVTIGSTTDLQKAKFQFTYTAGEDILSKQYRNVERIYGDYEAIGYTINPDTAPSDFAIGDQKISLVTRSTPSGVVNGNGYVMPMFLNESVQFVAPGPRCLYEAGEVAVQLYDDSTTTVVNTNVPVLNNYSEVYPSIDNFDLNWAPEVPPHPINGNPYNNLFNLYWRTYMNALYSPEARMMEASFALSLKDILTFQFSDKIWIQDSYWRIIEVSDYKVGDVESTKVKLLKFLEDTEDCSATPSTISTNGEVNFVDANDEPVDPSQDCCTRYGYTWDEANAVCWAFVPTGDRPNSPTSGSSTNPAPRQNKAQTRNAAIINSVIAGDNVTIENGNQNMLAVGERLELTKNVNGSNLLGKNVTTNLPGMHLGGGYRDGSSFVEKGWAQSGTIILHRKDAYAAAGNAFYYVEGITNEFIDLPNDTLWSCLLNVTIRDTNAGTYATGQYSFAISKTGGVAATSAVTALNTINTTAFTFTIGVNVAVPANHRLFLNVGGGGTFPVNIITTASLQYQQSKIT